VTIPPWKAGCGRTRSGPAGRRGGVQVASDGGRVVVCCRAGFVPGAGWTVRDVAEAVELGADAGAGDSGVLARCRSAVVGAGLGASLMWHALERAVAVAPAVRARLVVAHGETGRASGFLGRFGFRVEATVSTPATPRQIRTNRTTTELHRTNPRVSDQKPLRVCAPDAEASGRRPTQKTGTRCYQSRTVMARLVLAVAPLRPADILIGIDAPTGGRTTHVAVSAPCGIGRASRPDSGKVGRRSHRGYSRVSSLNADGRVSALIAGSPPLARE
jgi:hypothetical protein